MQRITLSLAFFATVGLLASAGQAQSSAPDVGHDIGRVEQVQIDSGQRDNLGELARMVWERKILRPGASFLQLEFGGWELPKGSWVELTSMKDMDTEVFDAETLALVNGESAYFNGSELRVRLFAGPHTMGNRVTFKGLGVGRASAVLSPLTICGAVDNRVLSNDKRVARIILKYSDNSINWCTAWLISRTNTFSSAGHCMRDRSNTRKLVLVTAQFNVPASNSTGGLVNPPATSQYTWYGRSASYRRWENGGRGKDWAVFATQINSTTKKHAGEVQGEFFRISTTLPAISHSVRVTGHGTDSTKIRNGVQQTHSGPYRGYSNSGGRNQIRYHLDTMGGNSGSPVIKTVGTTEYAIGVHTHGGCNTSPSSYNSGTYAGRTLFRNGRAAILNKVLPDLTVTQVGASDSTLYPGQRFLARMSVKNAGRVTVPENSTASFYLSTNSTISTLDTLLGNVMVTKLGVNAIQNSSLSVTVPMSYAAHVGTRYLGAIADRTRVVAELNEVNNTNRVAVTILAPAPDLTPTMLTSSVTKLYPRDRATVRTRINNIGLVASRPCLSTCYLSTNSIISTSDIALGSVVTGAIAKGAYRNYSFLVTAPNTLPNATCYFGIFADRNQKNVEVSEMNNTRALAVRCYSSARKPDLRIASMSLGSSNITGGGTVSVSVGVRNYGTASTGRPSPTGIFLSSNTTISTVDYYLGSVMTGTLAPNAVHSFRTTQTVPACPLSGNYYLGVFADFTNVIAESQELNNTRVLPVRLRATSSTLVQWRPIYNSAATNEVSASISTTRGGTANMCVIAPRRRGELYLAVWGGNGSSTNWSYGSLSAFSLSLLNGPIFPAWFGTVDLNGRAYPRLQLPAGGPVVPPFLANTRVFFLNNQGVHGWTSNRHYVRITR
ncbi:MAG: hypothetical protein CSA62_07780 [Planctomycetota bacterium]|nr:MAG: hypothetical protein CSA62_07780 [Planctomycetota bacterium]